MMNNIDASIGNADWTKRSWDLPTDIWYYHAMYGDSLKEYVAKIATLPVSKAMPDELRDEFKVLFPDLFDVQKEDTKSAIVKTIEGIIEGLQKFLESKGVQRHVRDSAYWGAPVGTPLPLPAGFSRSSELAATTPSLTLDDSVVQLHPAHTKVKNVKKIPTFDISVPGLLSKPFEYTDNKTGVTVTVRKISESNNYEVTARIGDDPSIIFIKQLPNKKSAFMHAQYQLKKPYIDSMHAKSLKSKRKTKGFHDLYSGRYGVDWSEDGPGFIQEDDIEGRWAAGIADANELGISYVNTTGSLSIHFESVETINTLARVHEEMIPGFSYYAPVYGVRPTPKGVVAYNAVVGSGMMGAYTSDKVDRVFIDPNRAYDYTAIALAKEYFSADWNVNATYNLLKFNRKNWWSVDPRLVAEENGYEDWEGLIFSTVTHELGHTIGRVVFGELKPNDFSDTPYRDQLRFEAQERLKDILEEFGVVNKFLPDARLSTSENKKVLEKLYGIDVEIITELLSRYGSKSFHELIAEAWAEYMLASRPRPLAQAIGEMMEDVMKKWIDNEFKDS